MRRWNTDFDSLYIYFTRVCIFAKYLNRVHYAYNNYILNDRMNDGNHHEKQRFIGYIIVIKSSYHNINVFILQLIIKYSNKSRDF